MSRRASFELLRPSVPGEAVAALVEHGDDAKVLAGGQSLGPMLSYHLIAPAVLIDINRVAELRGIEVRAHEVAIGATTTQATIAGSAQLRELCPLLVDATKWVAHPSVRERGTIGGSLAHNDPAGEYSNVLLALDARIRLLGPRGERVVDVASLVEDRILDTAIETDEIITHITIPAREPRTGHAFLELAERRGDYAIAGAAVTLTLAGDGETVESARVCAIGGLYPKRLSDVEEVLVGSRPSRALILEAASVGARQAPLGDDIHASEKYRRQLLTTLTARCLGKAWAGASA